MNHTLGLPYAFTPLDGIVTAGQPQAEHIGQLADAGFKSVIDLRASSEPRGFDEAATVGAAGMHYESIPVIAGTLGDAEFDRLRAVLRDRAHRPALVHCASANRVGALLIPYLVLDEGRTTEAALQLAQQVGLRSQELAVLALAYVRARSTTNESSQ